jgi:hypothetical protein
MRRGPVLLIVAGLVVIVLGWAVVLRGGSSAATPGGSSPSPSSAAVASDAPASAEPATPTVEPTPDPTPAPTAASATPAPTDRPADTEDPEVSYVRFLARLAEDRSTVADLNQRLADAGEGGDRATARATAVEILQFADGERDWLSAHPPADCYATAHAAATSMLEAYATVADRAIDWADADGLAAFAALADLVAAGDIARDALAQLATAVERTTCPG